MIGIDLTEIPHIGKQHSRHRRLQGNIFFTDLIEGQADPAVVDGFFLFKVYGYGVLFDERQPAVGFDQEAMRFDDLTMYLEGSVVKFGVIIDGGILVIDRKSVV